MIFSALPTSPILPFALSLCKISENPQGNMIIAGGERSVTPGNGTPNLLTLMG